MGKHITIPSVVTVAGDGSWSCTVPDMLQGAQAIQMKMDGAIVPGAKGVREFTTGEVIIPFYVGAGTFIHSTYRDQAPTIPTPATNLRSGDFLLLVISIDAAFMTIEDGWTLLAAGGGARFYYRFCPSPAYEGAVISTDPSGDYILTARLHVFRNIDSSTPFDRKDTALKAHSNSATWTGTSQAGIAASSMAIFVGVGIVNASVSAGVGIDTVDLSSTTSPSTVMQFVGYDADANGQTAAPTVSIVPGRAGYSWTAALKMA
jgi:hypothetical protein